MSLHQLGPLIRLWGLPLTDIPPPGVTSDDLAPFLITILQEAVPFLDTISPRGNTTSEPSPPWKSKGTKTYPDSTASVDILERTIPTTELELIMARSHLAHSHEQATKLRPEIWACRRSVHEDAARRGTASWDEFVDALKVRHAEAEEDFTPNIRSIHTPLEWDCSGVEAEEGGVVWRDFTLKVHESKHALAGPLKNRVFAVLQMTASAAGEDAKEFVVVSIAINDFANAPEAVLSKEKGPVAGAYTSVERVRKLESGEIEWVMATASDAKGVLPLWVQAKAVPGQVAKDVSLFLSWAEKERSKVRDGTKAPEHTAQQGNGTGPSCRQGGKTAEHGTEGEPVAANEVTEPEAAVVQGDAGTAKSEPAGPSETTGATDSSPPSVPPKNDEINPDEREGVVAKETSAPKAEA